MTDTVQPRPYLMKNKIRDYAWGTRDEKAFIPRFVNEPVEPGKPYAELWMGAHPGAPSELLIDGKAVKLDQLVQNDPEHILGPDVYRRFGSSFPFLFKVLSIAEPLSIQAHPTREQAAVLFQQDPGHYPDSNHKPEIAIALDYLTALVGLRSDAEILRLMHTHPEIVEFTGKEFVADWQNGLSSSIEKTRHIRSLVIHMLQQSDENPDQLAAVLDQLQQRLQIKKTNLGERETWFLNLRKTYDSADIGLLFIFLLNLVHLKKGQGIFLSAGIPHAYLAGTLVECMANSDNVVRVGLTPKFKDVRALAGIIDCRPGTPEIMSENATERFRYAVPVDDFQVEKMKLGSQNISTGNRPEIILVTAGEITVAWNGSSGVQSESCSRGQSLFIPACLSDYSLKGNPHAELFRASTPPVKA